MVGYVQLFRATCTFLTQNPSGKSGIGTMKRARSPSANERIAKMAKMEEETTHRSFRDRARQEYEQRKAEGRLGVLIRLVVPEMGLSHTQIYDKNQHNEHAQLLMKRQENRYGYCNLLSSKLTKLMK